MSRPFRVVTHKNWLAAQFAPMGAVQDFGFDIDPDSAGKTIWWAPGAWAASALLAGVRLPLMSCGPGWLDHLPRRFTGRRVQTVPVSEVSEQVADGWPDEVFAKLPEAKAERFPARLRGSRHLADDLVQYALPSDTLVQIQAPVEFKTEARFWIAHGEITAHSFYRLHDVIDGELIWGSEGFENAVTGPAAVIHHHDCLRRMGDSLRELLGDTPTPPGVVIDMGITTDDAVLVVEANAAWSSGPYDADPSGVFRAIAAAHDFADEYPEWAWHPNPALYKAGPLKTPTRGRHR
ncbi:MAG: ATP-grasp domain-containing protein [Mycobacterium sp.]|nr:ATP-grasp domain-containing protein [Mycobacterium sp.]